MKYTRLLKENMSGKDVLYIKQLLFWLGYYPSSVTTIKSENFGADTVTAVKNFQKKNKNAKGKKLGVDGKVGPESWESIVTAAKKAGYVYTRLLKSGMSGKDVMFIKQRLFAMNFYTDSVKKISSDSLGSDSVAAVKAFQKAKKDNDGKALTVDGIVGEKTFEAIVREASAGYKQSKPQPTPTPTPTPTPPKPEPPKSLLDAYTWISPVKRAAIEKDLINASDKRKNICLEILKYAYDKSQGGKVRALYIWGANLYERYATVDYINSRAKAKPAMFNNGRKEWMIKQVEQNGSLPCSDCSGMEVGYLRKFGYVDAKFDESANTLCSNTYSVKISRSDLKPGDWVGRDGHIGTYVGGGYVVEFYGGAYGCQLTHVDAREGYDFIQGKTVAGTKWTKFRDPRYY